MPTPLRFFLFFIVLAGLLLAANRHVLRWVKDAFHPPTWAQKTLFWVLGASFVITFAGRVIDYALWPGAPISGLLAAGSSVQLAALISSILLLGLDLVLFVLGLPAQVQRRLAARKPSAQRVNTQDPVAAEDDPTQRAVAAPAAEVRLPRRNFLVQASAGSALLVSGSSSLYGAISGRHDYELKEVAVRIPGLSKRFEGFTIAQISDIHIGQFVGSYELAAAEELIRRARPDLVVMTGDLLDHDVRRADELGRFVRRLVPLARHGVAAVTGNHDFYAGAEEVVAAVRAGGGRMLRNEAITVGEPGAGIALLGVDDLFGGREGRGPDLAGALSHLTRPDARVADALDLPRVLLCHQPVFFEQSAEHVALQLSGHTHGGQVNLLVRPADWVLPNGWVAGPYQRAGSTLYVNRGFGTAGPPARIGAAPEITRLVLTT